MPRPAREPKTVRKVARALLVDDLGRVLLFRARASPPGSSSGNAASGWTARPPSRRIDPPDAWWYCPGGAIEPGETAAQAVARELLEETGLQVDPKQLPPPVLRRAADFRWEGVLERHLEVYFLVRVVSPQLAPAAGAEPAHLVPEHRWWTSEEMLASHQRFVPHLLAERLAALLVSARRTG
ncbi:MAG TPA: NUDIX domain-containing protein [Candidatus Binatia bacterium]|nr:NUDIX domain-containing protein [Candidatus Binatia bacterium]